MSKKFDVVIGNPPYQEEAQGEGTRDTPLYHLFMEAAYEVAAKAILITPARFLFNAGFTPKSWNKKMLADRHLTVPHYFADSHDVFPGPEIKGGIAVTYWDSCRDIDPIVTFAEHANLRDVLHKVIEAGGDSLHPLISSGRAYAYTPTMHAEHRRASALMSSDAQFRVSTNTFEQLSFLYSPEKPVDSHEYIKVIGVTQKNKRATRWIRRAYISGPASFENFKVVVPAANGSGAFGEPLSSPSVIGPLIAVTQTFITIGNFPTSRDAEACLKYVKSKFARALLGVLKRTQHNPASVWKHVPAQDFTPSSDIDWSVSVSEIDRQLYAKYELNDVEIEFIESHVQPMD